MKTFCGLYINNLLRVQMFKKKKVRKVHKCISHTHTHISLQSVNKDFISRGHTWVSKVNMSMVEEQI